MARPKGQTTETLTVHVEASRCPTCGSTKRRDYYGITRQHYAGTTGDGKPYNVIVRRRTVCADCGQNRIDRTLEFDPAVEKGV